MLNLIDALKESEMFSGLDELLLRKIAAGCIIRTYPAGMILFRENDIGTVMYLVLSGAIKVFTSNSQGEVKILSIITKGESLGELSLLDGKPRSATAQVIEDATLMSLTEKKFNELLASDHRIALGIIRQLTTRLRETNRQVHDLTYLSAKQRILKSLLQQASAYGYRRSDLIQMRLRINYEELAQMAGVTKASLFNVLGELQDKKVLSYVQDVMVIDLSKLRGRRKKT